MSLEARFQAQREGFARDPYPSAKERRTNLRRLREALLARQEALAKALDADFGGRSRIEVLYSEVFVSVHALRHAEGHCEEWMLDRPVELDWPLQPASAWVMPQPVGVVGVIGPWNYPIFLAMAPLAGALAAGNRVMLKLSEFTPRTTAEIGELLAGTFAADHVTVVEGDAAVGEAFSKLPWDHLFFTGSTAVGRHVMRAAAENLTPVTLELGGKSPAILAPDAKLRRAAGDIAYGKLLNAGQTCIAPDYVLLPAGQERAMVEALKGAVEKLYPNAGTNADYTSVVNERQHARLVSYVDEARAAGVEVIELGASEGRRMAPVVLLNPPEHLRVMRDEIFGPILPLETYASFNEAIQKVNGRPRPLALYLFTGRESYVQQVLRQTVTGAVTINDTLVHVVAENLPFGGVGASGMGAYHGKQGFDTFSRLKPVFRRHGVGVGVGLRPPYGKLHEMMRKLLIR
jgi:acyl-CoA reductase-like NAD-dependent aldehyde dehydrogenase